MLTLMNDVIICMPAVDLVAEPDFHSKGPADVWTPRRPNFTE